MSLFDGPRFFDYMIGYGKMFAGFTLGHTLAPFRDPTTDITTLCLAGLLWGAGVVGIKYQERRGVVETPAEPETRKIPNLSDAPNGFMPLRDLTYQSVVKSARINESDPRLKQWAYAVAYNNTPMTQAKWAGKKRLFSKPEYVRWCGKLLKDKTIVPVNPKSGSSTYKPNGAAGWQEIKKIADGLVIVHLPTAELTERDTHFLRAQMRGRDSVGEGMD